MQIKSAFTKTAVLCEHLSNAPGFKMEAANGSCQIHQNIDLLQLIMSAVVGFGGTALFTLVFCFSVSFS